MVIEAYEFPGGHKYNALFNASVLHPGLIENNV